MSKTVTIDVISDVVCPWCYVGKRRLARALDLMPEIDAEVSWLPFRLDPTIPPGGIPREEYLANKFGSVEAAQETYDRLAVMGEDEGILFRFDGIAVSPNTVDAHRLIRWAAPEGLQNDMVERLFLAYFSEGLDVGDRNVLARLADETGLDEAAARLAGDDDIDATTAEIDNAYRIGVTGVPCFIVDKRLAVIGAHPAETLVEAIAQAVAERAAPTTDTVN